ncbi:Crp/Fnr family transcriptional regulator [Lentzea sp. NPDC054927]
MVEAMSWAPGTFVSRLDAGTRQELMSLGRRLEFPAGTVLLRQGALQTTVLVLTTARSSELACVKIVMTAEDGHESLLGIRTSGDLIGDMAALSEEPRTATALACKPTAVQKLSRDEFIAFLERRPHAEAGIRRMLVDRLSQADQQRQDYIRYDGPTRLARMIVELADRFGHGTEHGLAVGVDLSQREWGQLIGAREDSVRRAMRQLRDLKLIINGYCDMTVVDVAGLRRFAHLKE